MTRDEVTRLLAFFAEAYPNTRVPANPSDRVDVWYLALADEDADAMFAAARLIVQMHGFHPSPHDCIDTLVNGTAWTGQMARIRLRLHLERKIGRIEEAG